ncbi:MAG TPA: exosortase system-associated protein, TIGR04073 family [Candidatus Hydrogenedentes bacterium]|nr:exosortase system-associated protein, TIGR04073 family [Candidatus Hydrogenedentota bacterium]HOS01797.1 exosortase system-associated protein, TIGR04073 family [Candidatus Hydrogenedentota bacterium]
METRRSMWVKMGVIALAVAIGLQAMPALAQSYDPADEIPKPTGFEKGLTKFGRGLSNIMLGWAEIPVTFDKKLKEGKPLGYLLGVAPVLGAARAFMRTGTGVFEAITFPFSDRSVNYEAILKPDYIF